MATKIILVAEDDTFLGETICESLKEHDVEAHHVHDGLEAMQFIEKKKPDLLLLDLIMPRKDGFAVLREVHEKQYGFPVVILSNLSMDLNPEKCRALHATDYVVKSDIDEDDLWPKISKYL